MSKSVKALCILLVVVFAALMPFALPSGALLEDEKMRMEEEIWALEEESSWLFTLLPAARAEAPALTPLPMDFSPGQQPNPAAFTQEGYQDDSITLKLETKEEEGVVWRVAHITISDPSQLRTTTAGSPRSSRVALISSMAEKNNAIIATNANYMSNDPVKTSFEYRMGEKVRNKFNGVKDLLITDEKGNLHIFTGKDKKSQMAAFESDGHTIVNAFTFGPALVVDGTLQTIPEEYGYNPHGREPRMAFGQVDTLSYVMVLAEGRTQDSQGVTQQELADYMFNLGCMQAFNFDGGNSATMVYNGGYYQQKTKDNERAQSDMLYFATLVDPASWQ